MKQNNKQEQVQLQKSMEQDQEELKIKQQIQVLDKVKKTMYSRINEFNKEEQELIKRLDNLEQQKKENYKNYLEGFDEEFETHTKVRIKETPLLIGIFNEFVQQVYRPSKMYWLVAKTKEIINQELIKKALWLLRHDHFARLEKIPGHLGISGNEIADAIATGDKQRLTKLLMNEKIISQG